MSGDVVLGVLLGGSWILAAWLGYREGYDQAKAEAALDRIRRSR